jgi:hypothetical protein
VLRVAVRQDEAIVVAVSREARELDLAVLPEHSREQLAQGLDAVRVAEGITKVNVGRVDLLQPLERSFPLDREGLVKFLEALGEGRVHDSR